MSLFIYHSSVKVLTITAIAFIFSSQVYADSPANLKKDIPWFDTGSQSGKRKPGYSGVKDIVAAFNHARRQEEKQLGLPVNTIKDLVLPSQATWDEMSDDAKALYLINNEREARAKSKPKVLGLPFAGIEYSLDIIAERYASLLYNTNTRSHYQPSGDATIDGPTRRIEQDAVIGSKHSIDIQYNFGSIPTHTDNSPHYYADSYHGKKACHDFIARSENLAFFSKDDIRILPVERSIYRWIYTDATSHWVHRETVLLQDKALTKKTGKSGFRNDNGSMKNEGFIGFHLIPPSKSNPILQQFGYVIVLNIFDPVSDEASKKRSCTYNVTLKSNELPQPVKATAPVAPQNTTTAASQPAVDTEIVATIKPVTPTNPTVNTPPAAGNTTVANQTSVATIKPVTIASQENGTTSSSGNTETATDQTTVATIKPLTATNQSANSLPDSSNTSVGNQTQVATIIKPVSSANQSNNNTSSSANTGITGSQTPVTPTGNQTLTGTIKPVSPVNQQGNNQDSNMTFPGNNVANSHVTNSNGESSQMPTVSVQPEVVSTPPTTGTPPTPLSADTATVDNQTAPEISPDTNTASSSENNASNTNQTPSETNETPVVQLPENKPPVATTDLLSTYVNTPSQPVNVLVNDSDPDGDQLIIIANSNPANGSVKRTDDNFVYTPNNNFSGKDSFFYIITDSHNHISIGIVEINVTPRETAVTPAIPTTDITNNGVVAPDNTGVVAPNNTGTFSYNSGLFAPNSFAYLIPKIIFSGLNIFPDTATITNNISNNYITINTTNNSLPISNTGNNFVSLLNENLGEDTESDTRK